MTTTWTGAAGDLNIDNSGNWDKGVPNRDDGEGPHVIFDNAGTLALTGSLKDTSDGGSITVTGFTHVTVNGSRWSGNITIEEGSSLTLGQTDFKSSEIELGGTLNIVDVFGIDSGGNGARVHFGVNGFMDASGVAMWGGSSWVLSGALATTDAALAMGMYEYRERTLLTVGSLPDGMPSLGDFTTADGVTLTLVSEKMTDDAALNADNYYLYIDGNSLKVQYVVEGTGAIPESSTATLSLLALAGMAMRRRRA